MGTALNWDGKLSLTSLRDGKLVLTPRKINIYVIFYIKYQKFGKKFTKCVLKLYVLILYLPRGIQPSLQDKLKKNFVRKWTLFGQTQNQVLTQTSIWNRQSVLRRFHGTYNDQSKSYFF